MRVRGRQAPSHSHTWLPYITPNGVRLAHHDTLMILSNIMQKKIRILSTLPNGVRLAHQDTLMILSNIMQKKMRILNTLPNRVRMARKTS